jgi:hypothetical protein
VSGQKFDRAKLDCEGKQESMMNDRRKVGLYATDGGELGGGLAQASRWQSRRTTGWLAYPAHSVIVHRCLTTGGWGKVVRREATSHRALVLVRVDLRMGVREAAREWNPGDQRHSRRVQYDLHISGRMSRRVAAAKWR